MGADSANDSKSLFGEGRKLGIQQPYFRKCRGHTFIYPYQQLIASTYAKLDLWRHFSYPHLLRKRKIEKYTYL